MTVLAHKRQTLISRLISEIEDQMRESDFQRDFFEDLSTQFHRRYDLTDKQIECLKRMFERVTGEELSEEDFP